MKFKTLLPVALILAAAAAPRGEILEQILVKVNGDIFTKSDLEQRQIAALRQKGQAIDLKSDPNNVQLRKALDEVTPQIMVEAVDEMVIVQRGKELGYTLSDAQFRSVVDNIRKENKIENDEQFQAALKAENMTLADLRRNLERSMIVTQVQRAEVNDKVSVNEEEARAYYAARPREFTTPAEFTLRELLIEVPANDRGVNVAQDDEAKAKAEDIRKRLQSGEPFARLATDFSASSSKTNGGLIGPIKHDELDPRLQKVLDAMQVGDVTEPLRTQRGYQLLKVETRTETRVKTFEQARAEISNKVAEQKRQVELLKYLDQLREQATITWRNDDLKKAYEQGLEKRRQQQAAAPPASGATAPAKQ